MKTLLVTLALLNGCVESTPSAPYVHVISNLEDSALLDGVRAWEPLGFSFGFQESSLPECPPRWWVSGETECQISVWVEVDPDIRKLTGSNALSNIDTKDIAIDSSLVIDPLGFSIAAAHEMGHVLLHTKKHTSSGVMSGTSSYITRTDKDLACEEILICL